jgi:hypothetical protein
LPQIDKCIAIAGKGEGIKEEEAKETTQETGTTFKHT